MSYFDDYKEIGSGCLMGIVSLIGVFFIVIMLYSCVNKLTENTWNDGKCIECETRYELRGVSNGLKYYACPECGQEVERY